MKYIVKKIITLIITLLVISFVTFSIFTIIPGNSAISKLGTEATKEAIEALNEELGYNKPLINRYLTWIGGVIKGDFGISSQYKQPVNELLKERLPVSISLGLISIVMIVLISIPLGILSAKKEGGIIDQLISTLSQITMAIPPFFLGIIITLIFGIILKWFTPGKFIDFKTNITGFINFLIYPALAIALPKSSMVIKFLRSSIINQLTQDYVRTAYSKGSSENYVLYKHVLKNALIPVITFFGMVMADILAGSIIVEQVFNIPGLGRLLIVSISNRDFNIVQAIVLYMAVIVIVINFIVDMLYKHIDPRVD